MRAYPLECDDLVDDLLQGVGQVTADVQGRFGALDEAALVWSPGPGRWSVGECLAHLTQVGRLYRERIDGRLADARARGLTSRRPVVGSWFGRWFTRALGPDGRRVPAPRAFRPAPHGRGPGPGTREAFLAEQVALSALFERARGLDLDAVRVASPVSALVRFHVGDALRFLVAHERRHLAQAIRVTTCAGFPDAGGGAGASPS